MRVIYAVALPRFLLPTGLLDVIQSVERFDDPCQVILPHGARPTIVRRGHPCAHGARRAPHGRPHGPRVRAQRSAPRPFLVQRRASAPRPPAPRLRRTRVVLPGPLSHGWWGCQGTRPPPTPRVLVHTGGAATRTGPWGGPAAAPGPRTIVGRALPHVDSSEWNDGLDASWEKGWNLLSQPIHTGTLEES